MSEVIEQAVDPIQAAVDELLELGKKRGYVTWEEMNEILPDDAIDPAQLEIIMMCLEEAKIETLDEADADRYERRRRPDYMVWASTVLVGFYTHQNSFRKTPPRQ